jgi:hypothetical protein
MKKTDPVDVVMKQVDSRGAITNRDCRQLLGISYDETIFLLGGMCKVGLLMRKGVSSGTHYVMTGMPVSEPTVSKFKDELAKRLRPRNG